MGHTSLLLLLLALLAGPVTGRQLHQSVSVQTPLQKVRLQPQFRDWPLPLPPCAKPPCLPCCLSLMLLPVAGCATAARCAATHMILQPQPLATLQPAVWAGRLRALLLAAHAAAALCLQVQAGYFNNTALFAHMRDFATRCSSIAKLHQVAALGLGRGARQSGVLQCLLYPARSPSDTAFLKAACRL